MAMSGGQKLGVVAVVGLGAFLLAGGSSKAAGTGAKPIDPCVDPKDCATLTKCASAVMATATKADVPTLQGMLVTANKLGCTELAKQLDTLIKKLSTTTTTPPKTQKYTILVGENPDTVATKFGTTIAGLLALNPDLKGGLTGQEVSSFNNSVRGSRIEGTSSGQIDAGGDTFITSIFTPTMGVVITGGKGYPVYDASERVKGAGNNSVYFPGGKASQPYAAGGPNPARGRAYFAAGAWRWVAQWATGQVINVPADVTIGGSVGGEVCEHEVSVAGDCSACMGKRNSQIHNIGSLGPYDTVPDYNGAVLVDAAFGSPFGAGYNPIKNKVRVFGAKRFGY